MKSRNPHALDPLEPRLLLAHPGELDTSFSGDGRLVMDVAPQTAAADFFGERRAVVVTQPDGKVILGGSTLGNGVIPEAIHLARYNPDGTPDSTFGSNGRKIILSDIDVTDAALSPDGKVVLVGHRVVQNGSTIDDYFGHWAVIRLMPDGTPDPLFSGDGFRIGPQRQSVETGFYDVVVDSLGRVVVAGYDQGPVVCRFNVIGGLDGAFQGDGYKYLAGGSTAGGLSIAPDGDIVVANDVNVDSNSVLKVARIRQNGDMETSFGASGYATVPLAPYDPAGSFLADRFWTAFEPGGGILAKADHVVVRLNDQGEVDTAFGEGGGIATGSGDSGLVVQGDGKFLTFGRRYNPDGTPDAGFVSDAPIGAGAIDAVALAPGNKLVAAGSDGGDFFVVRVHASPNPAPGEAVANLVSLTGDDEVLIRRAGDVAEVFVNDGEARLQYTIAQMADLVIDTLGGDDTLTVSFSSGSPLHSSGMTFTGSRGGDTLSVIGSRNADPFALNQDYVVAVTAFIYHDEPEAIRVDGLSGNDTFVFNRAGDPDQQVTLLGNVGDDTFLYGGGDVRARMPLDVTIDGGGGEDTLVDENDSHQGHAWVAVNGNRVVHLDRDTIGSSYELSYGGIEELELRDNDKSSLVQVTSLGTPGAPVRLTVRPGGGEANVLEGDRVEVSPTHTVGQVHVLAPAAGSNVSLSLFSYGGEDDQEYVINNSVVAVKDGPSIFYQGIDSLGVVPFQTDDVFQVLGNPTAIPIFLSTSGSDTIVVDAHQPAVPVELISADAVGDRVTVRDGSHVRFRNTALLLSLTMTGAARASLGGAAAEKSLGVQNLSLGEGSTIDLGDGLMRVQVMPGGEDAVLDYITSRVAKGRNANPADLWSGAGITSSVARDDATGRTGLGIRQPSQDLIEVSFGLAGDVNRDRKVDFADLVRVAQNYGATGRSFAQGNLDFDPAGNVGFGDLVLLAQGYGGTLPTPAVSSPELALSASPAVRDAPSRQSFNTATPVRRPVPRSPAAPRGRGVMLLAP